MPNDCAQAQAKLEQYSEAVADSRAAFNNASGADERVLMDSKYVE